MTSTKYIGMDVHKESISVAVMNAAGKIVMECVIETKASMILQCIDGLRGDLHVTFEEGTSAAWLYDLLKPHVTELIVCDPRKNASMREDNQNDKIDARQPAGVNLVILIVLSHGGVLPRIADNQFRHVRFQKVVQPGGRGSFLKRDVQIPAQSVDTLQNHTGFRLDDAFHHDLPSRIHHRDRNAFLMHIHADIFSASHKGCPFWEG